MNKTDIVQIVQRLKDVYTGGAPSDGGRDHMQNIDNVGAAALLIAGYGECSAVAALKQANKLLSEGRLAEAARFTHIAADLAEKQNGDAGSGAI